METGRVSADFTNELSSLHKPLPLMIHFTNSLERVLLGAVTAQGTRVNGHLLRNRLRRDPCPICGHMGERVASWADPAAIPGACTCRGTRTDLCAPGPAHQMQNAVLMSAGGRKEAVCKSAVSCTQRAPSKTIPTPCPFHSWEVVRWWRGLSWS